MAAPIAHVTIYEDSGVTLMSRIVGHDAANIAQADVTSATRKVFLNGATNSSTTLTVASVVFDTLQTDARWTVDSTGYNFADVVDDDVFTAGDGVYTVEYKITPATGADYHWTRRVHTKALQGS